MKKSKMLLTGILAGAMMASLVTAGIPMTEARADTTSGTVGKWMTGEYHAHTCESKDADGAKNTPEMVFDNAFNTYGLDYLFLADHLRSGSDGSELDANANPLGTKIAMSNAMQLYQLPKIQSLLSSGKYNGKVIYTGNEWDMPMHDHVSVGLLTNGKNEQAPVEAVKQFQYLFTKCSPGEFTSEEIAQWGNTQYNSTAQDALEAIKWVKNNYPNSYMLLNHPSRHNGGSGMVTIKDIRDFNNLAPNVVFGFEGMPGNQMSPDGNRCELKDIYGGADVMIAKVGGVWDALLGEGRHFWNFANSDFHFKISGPYSSGYWPGEYSKNHTWVEGNDVNAIVNGLRSGKSYSTYGDLINSLDFKLSGNNQQAEMGGTLDAAQGDSVTVTIRFKSPEKNNNGDSVQVDHVDLISGEVHSKIDPSSPDYTKATNDTTKVVARFTNKDWTTDKEGYHVITFKTNSADKSRYFRLRGTNLGIDVPGKMENGEPLQDVSINSTNTPDNNERFAKLNERNYSNLWFYSNPIFMNVTACESAKIIKDAGTGVSITGNLPVDATASVAEKLAGTDEYAGIHALISQKMPNLQNMKLYDISLLRGGVKYQPNSSVSISLPIPDGFDSTRPILVYRQEADHTLTELAVTVSNGMVTFNTDHFSLYTLAQQAPANTSSSNLNSNTSVSNHTQSSMAVSSSISSVISGSSSHASPLTGDFATASLILVTIGVCAAAIGTLAVLHKKHK